MNIYDIESGWPLGISDGLTLKCGDCGHRTNYDYTVTDEFWERIVPEKDKKYGIICLDCIDKRAKLNNEILSHYLLKVQYTGIGETIVLKPEISFVYK